MAEWRFIFKSVCYVLHLVLNSPHILATNSGNLLHWWWSGLLLHLSMNKQMNNNALHSATMHIISQLQIKELSANDPAHVPLPLL